MRMHRALVAWLGLVLVPGIAHAGVLYGKVDLPAALPERPPPATKGFLDRVENPFAPVKGQNVTQQMVIVLEGQDKSVSPPQINWDLVGESFARPVIAAPAGAEVVIKDLSKTARTLVAKEDPKLIPSGPINPTGTKSFRVTEAGKSFTIGDKDAPHLVGRLVVVGSPYIAYPDEAGHFEINDIPPGAYKLKIWYRDGWMHRDDDDVTVAAKGKTDFNPKLPAGAFAPPAAQRK
jgi:hypothetical protein